MAGGVDPPAPGSPGELGVLAGVRNSWRSPVNLVSFSMTTVRAGMLMPSARVSVANTTLHQSLAEAVLHRLLERRHHPGVVGGQPGVQTGRATGS